MGLRGSVIGVTPYKGLPYLARGRRSSSFEGVPSLQITPWSTLVEEPASLQDSPQVAYTFGKNDSPTAHISSIPLSMFMDLKLSLKCTSELVYLTLIKLLYPTVNLPHLMKMNLSHPIPT